MKPRLPTPEERKLWRESNKLTSKASEHFEEDTELDSIAATPVETSPLPQAITHRPMRNNAPTSSLTPLPVREANRVFKSHPVGATLDLHGFTKLEAYEHLLHFIGAQQRAGRRHLVIITGKGKNGDVGVLRSNLPHWLNEPALRPYISAFSYARPEKGGAGVLHVLLKAR